MEHVKYPFLIIKIIFKPTSDKTVMGHYEYGTLLKKKNCVIIIEYKYV